MDPNATWELIRFSMVQGDHEVFMAAIKHLQQWVERGGVYPKAWGANAGAWRVWLAYVTTMMET